MCKGEGLNPVNPTIILTATMATTRVATSRGPGRRRRRRRGPGGGPRGAGEGSQSRVQIPGRGQSLVMMRCAPPVRVWRYLGQTLQEQLSGLSHAAPPSSKVLPGREDPPFYHLLSLRKSMAIYTPPLGVL